MIQRYLFEMDKEYDFLILKSANLTLILQLEKFQSKIKKSKK